MSYSIRQNICKNTVYNDTINCNSNGGIIVRNEINLQDRMLAALRQQSQNTTFFLMNGFQKRRETADDLQACNFHDHSAASGGSVRSERGACGQLITYEALHGTKTKNKTGTAAET